MVLRQHHLLKWLDSVFYLILLMILIGGLTRLTESGLSMVDWRPLMGAIPPMTQADWQEVFAQYQKHPEYIKLRPDLGLEEFKTIFYWEYSHRLLGRFLGLFFIGPFLFFWAKGYFSRTLKIKLSFALLLGGSQGLLGWYMVKSGLIDIPRVSHLRLAAHLSLALFLACYIKSIVWSLTTYRKPKRSAPLFGWSLLLLVLLSVQTLFGAFTAGMDAGKFLNTFPTMNGHWLHPQLLQLQPIWLNPLWNAITIQFIHRVLGVSCFLLGGLYLLYCIRIKGIGDCPPSLWAFGATLAIQVFLGISTLLLEAPILLSSLHQMVACVLIVLCLRQIYLWKS